MRTWDLERRIRRVWNRATEHERELGARWYAVAHGEAAEIAADWHVPLHAAAGVLAAISPGNEWSTSIAQARALCRYWRYGGPRPKVSTYSQRNVAKAIAILDSAPAAWPRGPKVTAFYWLILTKGEARDTVCVDTHAANLAHGVHESVRNVQYRETEMRRTREAYKRLAKKLDVLPSTLQATTWLAWKRIRRRKR